MVGGILRMWVQTPDINSTSHTGERIHRADQTCQLEEARETAQPPIPPSPPPYQHLMKWELIPFEERSLYQQRFCNNDRYLSGEKEGSSQKTAALIIHQLPDTFPTRQRSCADLSHQITGFQTEKVTILMTMPLLQETAHVITYIIAKLLSKSLPSKQ